MEKKNPHEKKKDFLATVQCLVVLQHLQLFYKYKVPCKKILHKHHSTKIIV